jgi:glutathione S-transferase
MADLQIIGGAPSNFVWVTRVVCIEKGVPYTHVQAMAHTPEVDAIHPFGKIPVMRHGDVTLCETRAIIGYIDAVFPGKPLLPREPVAAARAEQWLSLINTTIDQVCMRQYVVQYAFPSGPEGKPDRARIEAALPGIRQQVEWLDEQLTSEFALPPAFSAVDADLVPILHYLTFWPESAAMLREAPRAGAYLARMLEHPSIRASAPPPRPKQA